MPTKNDFLASLDPLKCSLCLDLYDKTHVPVELECGHIFGDYCIANVAESETQNNNRCPLCRRKLFEQEDFDSDGELIHARDQNEEEGGEETADEEPNYAPHSSARMLRAHERALELREASRQASDHAARRRANEISALREVDAERRRSWLAARAEREAVRERNAESRRTLFGGTRRRVGSPRLPTRSPSRRGARDPRLALRAPPESPPGIFAENRRRRDLSPRLNDLEDTDEDDDSPLSALITDEELVTSAEEEPMYSDRDFTGLTGQYAPEDNELLPEDSISQAAPNSFEKDPESDIESDSDMIEYDSEDDSPPPARVKEAAPSSSDEEEAEDSEMESDEDTPEEATEDNDIVMEDATEYASSDPEYDPADDDSDTDHENDDQWRAKLMPGERRRRKV